MECNLILLNLNYFSLLITCLLCNFYYKHFSSDNSQASITSDNFVSKDRKINRVSLNSSDLTDLENAAIYYDDCSAAYKQKKYINYFFNISLNISLNKFSIKNADNL